MDVSYVEVMLIIVNLKFLIELRMKANADDEIQQETEVKWSSMQKVWSKTS